MCSSATIGREGATRRGWRSASGRLRTGAGATVAAGLWLSAFPAFAQITSGTYQGNGVAGRPIAGLGFRPDVVLVKVNYAHPVNDDLSSGVIRTVTMPDPFAKPVKGNQALQGNLITSLDANGFTVGNDLRVNDNTTCAGPCTYYWVALKADGNIKVASYGGTGGVQAIGGLGFSPEYVAVFPETTHRALNRFKADTNSYHWWAGGPDNPGVTSLDANGFTVTDSGGNPSLNSSGTTYHYLAITEATGRIRISTYAGTGSAQDVLGPGFRPELVLVKALVPQSNDPLHKTTGMGGATSIDFRDASTASGITALLANGFRVGTSTGANASGTTYAYLALGTGTCCALATVEGAGTITVTGQSSFDMTFDTTAGGSIRLFHDLAENPAYDLAGGTLGGLLSDSLESGGTWYDTSYNTNGAKLDLLEATATRVRVRAESSYEDAGVVAPGLKAYADYSIHPSGRLALRWERRATATFNYGGQEIDQTVHLQGAAPLNNWTAYSQSGPMPGLGSDVFTLIKSDTTGVKTDFLRILHTPWAQADWTNWSTDAPGEWGFTTWRENDPGSLSPGTSESFYFAVYFKPTDLGSTANPWQDPAVTARSDDYTSPAAPGIMAGASWQDPDENTGSDNFNEAEAAYLFTLHPTDGLRFDLDGAAPNPVRFKPFFKIRQWHSFTPPWTITFDIDSGGPTPPVTLRRDVHYKADVKPVSRASFADDLRWHSTLQDNAAVTSPDVGTGGTVGGTAGPAPGKYGQGYLFDADGEEVTVATAGDFDVNAGAVEFWYQPRYGHDDGFNHRLWTYQVDIDHQFIGWKLPNGNLQFEVRNGPGAPPGGTDWTRTTVNVANYGWQAFDWVHLRFTWDASAGPGQELHIFINGVEPPNFDLANDFNPQPADWPDGLLRIGLDSNLTNAALGVIDEFRIYNSPVAPGPGGPTPDLSGRSGLAHGGLAGPTEYLADPTLNFALGLSPVDDASTRRGEYAYFGSDSKFGGLNVVLDQAGTSAGTLDLQWQYWNGTAWTNLTVIDETAAFTKTGTVYWTGDLYAWKPYSVNGGPDLYHVRAYLKATSGAYASAPIEAIVTTDLLLFQYCGDVTTDNQEFTFGAPPPTLVSLQSFEARPADAAVDLRWSTASELDNLGFHLQRSLRETGPWERITPSLIAGLGSSPTGASYSWRDTGLVNGTRYFYRLEDVDTGGVSTFHGPVSAMPQAMAPGGGENGGEGDGDADGDGSGEGGEGDGDGDRAGGGSYGDPSLVQARVVSRSSRRAVVELLTGGFIAVREGDGRVRVRIPGFEDPEDPHAPALPFKRVVVDGEAGLGARISSVRAWEEEYPGLLPSAVGYREMEVFEDGTVRPVMRATSLRDPEGGYLPRELAALGGVAFVGERKRVFVELHPLRFDAGRGGLRLAKRLRVEVEFVGREEESGGGSIGRRVPRLRHRGEEPLAFLHVKERGLHAARFEDLFPKRLRPLPVSLLALRRGGEGIPFHVEPQGRSFEPGSVLFFWADRGAESTSYSGEAAYELARGTGGGGRMPVVEASPFGDLVGTSLGRAAVEVNRIYQAGLVEATDLWQWEALVGGVSKAKAFELLGVDGSRSGRVRVWLQGGSDAEGVVDHRVEVRLNGTWVGETQFDGKRPHLFEGEVAGSVLLEGGNELEVRNVGDTGVPSMVFLDRFEVSYPQVGELRGGLLEGEWREEGVAEIALAPYPGSPLLLPASGGLGPRPGFEGPGGLPDSTGVQAGEGSGQVRSAVSNPGVVYAVDVTEGARPLWLTGHEQGPSGTLRLRVEAERRYVLATPEGLLRPRIEAPLLTSLRSEGNQADYVVIAPRAFLPAAEALLERRESEGLRTKAASLEEIASAFGHGETSGEAIRSFLTYAYHSWQRPSPRYVLLLGDGSYDPRSFTGTAAPAPLPVLFVKTPYLVTASDPSLGAVNGEDQLPDVSIGRLPAQTVEEADALVRKLLDWEARGEGLGGEAVLVADNPDEAGDFEADVRDIRESFLAGRETRTILLRVEGASGTRVRVLEAFDRGAGLMSYVGHGGPAVWASENVWNSWDVESLRAQGNQPLMLTLNCLNGYFVAPNFDSLSEAYLKAEGRGTIGAFSPSGLSLDGPAHALHRELMKEITGGAHERLGDAILAAEQSYAGSGEPPELLSVYHLFGDPGMRIR